MISKLFRGLTIGGITIGGESVELEHDGHILRQPVGGIPANSDDFEILCPVTIADVLRMGLAADQDCTVKTNDPADPDDTIELKADKALVYDQDDPDGCNFFSTDVTALYVTTGETVTHFAFGAAVDSTP